MVKILLISLFITLLITSIVVYLVKYFIDKNNKTIIIKTDDKTDVTFTTEKIKSLTKAFYNICKYETEVTIIVDSYIVEIDKKTNEITLTKDVSFEENKRLKEEERLGEIEKIFESNNERKVNEPSEFSDEDVTIPKHEEGIEISKEIDTKTLVDEQAPKEKESFLEKIDFYKNESMEMRKKSFKAVNERAKETLNTIIIAEGEDIKSNREEELEEKLITSREILRELGEESTLFNLEKKEDLETYNEFNL